MPVTEARIDTDRPGRYLVQFCKHAQAMGSSRGHRIRAHGGWSTTPQQLTIRAEWTDTSGTVEFDPWGRCRLATDDADLVVQVEAADPDELQLIKDIVTNDLHRFSSHQLQIVWNPVDGQPPQGTLPHRAGHGTALLSSRYGRWVAAAVIVVVIAAHLGAGGFLFTHWEWSIGVIAAIITVKVLVVIGYQVLKRRPARPRLRR